MIRRRNLFRSSVLCVLLSAAVMLPACSSGGGGGGGGGGGMMNGPLMATFTADDPSPGPDTVSMETDISGSDSFQVRVLVTDIDDFFGAAFQIEFDPVVAEFVPTVAAALSAGSFLPSGLFFAEIQQGDPGTVEVEASLQGTVAGIPNASGTLITLEFRARTATSNSPFGFDDRVVKICSSPSANCPDLSEPPLSWAGGRLTASN